MKKIFKNWRNRRLRKKLIIELLRNPKTNPENVLCLADSYISYITQG